MDLYTHTDDVVSRDTHGICETNPTKKKNLLTAIFKRTMGIYTHIDDVMSHDKHGISEWALLPLRVTL